MESHCAGRADNPFTPTQKSRFCPLCKRNCSASPVNETGNAGRGGGVLASLSAQAGRIGQVANPRLRYAATGRLWHGAI